MRFNHLPDVFDGHRAAEVAAPTVLDEELVGRESSVRVHGHGATVPSGTDGVKGQRPELAVRLVVGDEVRDPGFDDTDVLLR